MAYLTYKKKTLEDTTWKKSKEGALKAPEPKSNMQHSTKEEEMLQVEQ